MKEETKITGSALPTAGDLNPKPAQESRELATTPAHAGLPVAQPSSKGIPTRRWWIRIAIVLAVVVAVAGAAFYWWRQSQSQLPPGIGWGNGRIEADQIDIDTKFAGRIAEMLVDEGDMVKAQEVLARMDTRDLEASLKKSEAQVQGARQSLEEAHADVVQQSTQVTLAQQEFDRTNTLVAQGFATNELLDQRRQTLNGATAALMAARDRVGEAARALDAVTHDVELYKVNIADNTLVAPHDGRIQYRISNIGEVLPAGGRVFTMFDIAYVYMDVYLPTDEIGKIKIGDDARIVLDAIPSVAIPAKVAFIETQAQFTPKTVEVKDERDKLMFRIRVKIDPERLRARAASVRSGLPGVAYIRFDPALAWPPKLQGTSRNDRAPERGRADRGRRSTLWSGGRARRRHDSDSVRLHGSFRAKARRPPRSVPCGSGTGPFLSRRLATLIAGLMN